MCLVISVTSDSLAVGQQRNGVLKLMQPVTTSAWAVGSVAALPADSREGHNGILPSTPAFVQPQHAHCPTPVQRSFVDAAHLVEHKQRGEQHG